MSEFDGKQFYGFSMQNDPSLSTTTKNFEFRYMRPEFLEKAIEKVHNKDDPKLEQKNMMWQNYCQMRAATPETEKQCIGILKKDLDVETQINSSISKNAIQIRKLSEKEVDNLIDKMKHKNEASPSKKLSIRCNSPHEKVSKSPQNSSPKKNMTIFEGGEQLHKYKTMLRNKNPHKESQYKEEIKEQNNQSSICTSIAKNKTIHMVDNFEPHITMAQTPQIIDNVILEEYRRPQPKWVEIKEPSKESRLEVDVKHNDIEIYNSGTSQPTYSYRYDHYKMPIQKYPQMTHCMPAVLMTEVITDNLKHGNEYINAMQCNEENIGSYFIEDSDLEQELTNRSQYTKYTQPRLKPGETLNLSIDDDHEIESGKTKEDEQYLLNSSPQQFTDDQTQENYPMQIYINGLAKQSCQNEYQSVASETIKTPDSCLSPQKEQLCTMTMTTKTLDRYSSSKKKQQLLKSKTKLILRQQTLERLAGGTCTSSSTPHENLQTGRSSRTGSKSASVNKETKVTNQSRIKSTKNELHSQRTKNLVVSKSIEDLKAEKTNIFNKMTATQEKMIEALDKLRLSLLELNTPENCYETTRRQKNSFEFSVRFSRNFLYPLKGMQEDLILTSNEQFNSLNSNDATNRLCYMFSLLLQSLNTYQKQIRFFLLDHVHQKLKTLIEIIYSTTAICLEKKIFSKHDTIIDCLQQRCSEFLEFLVELQEGRLQVDRQSYRKLTLDKAHAHTKYDLKMLMNDLNMYEPKLVPKAIVTDRSAKTKKNKAKRPINQVIVDDAPDTLMEKPPEDTIPTHIQAINANKSSGCVLNTQLNMASGDGKSLDNNVIEALQNVTKEQVRKVLEPILESLGSALGNQHNSETIETILNAFNFKQLNTLETEKQQYIDNKYAKETEPKANELSSVGSLRYTCKSLEAAKQTKTLLQQNSHKALSKIHSSTTTGIIVDDYNDDDDDNENSNNGNNKYDSNNNANSKRNNKRNSNKRNLTTHLRRADGGGGVGGGGVGGEHNCEAKHMKETTTSAERILKKSSKSKKLMNEDQIVENAKHKEEQVIHSYGYPRNKAIQENISTSDSEGGHNLKLKKHLRRNNVFSHSNTSKPHLKSHDSCITKQRSSSLHSQCQIPSSLKNCPKKMLSHRNSLHCLQTVKTQSRWPQNKRDQTLPPAPSVLPSSSGHFKDHKENDDKTQLDQISSQRNGEKNMWGKMNSMDNVKLALTESTKTLETGKASGNESDDYAETGEQGTNVEEDSDFDLDSDNKVEMSLGASYIKSNSPAYANNFPYYTSEDSPRLKSMERKLKYEKNGNKTNHMPPLKSIKENRQHNKTSNDQQLRQDNLSKQSTENIDFNDKHNIHIGEMIQERDRFLEMCRKNRFYKNPNYAEPWKVFSSISERLLNDVLSSVENDFAVGVSKFVEDFLALETKT